MRWRLAIRCCRARSATTSRSSAGLHAFLRLRAGSVLSRRTLRCRTQSLRERSRFLSLAQSPGLGTPPPCFWGKFLKIGDLASVWKCKILNGNDLQLKYCWERAWGVRIPFEDCLKFRAADPKKAPLFLLWQLRTGSVTPRGTIYSGVRRGSWTVFAGWEGVDRISHLSKTAKDGAPGCRR